MIELKRINVRQYVELEDKSEYDFAMKYAFAFTEPTDEYQVGDVMELTFGFVKDFQYELEKGLTYDKLFKFISEVSHVEEKQLGTEPLDKVIRFSNYLINSIKEIIEVEGKTLVSELSEKEEMVMGDKFKELGVYLQIRSLTGGDVTKNAHVRSLPYSECFAELYTAKQLSDYQKDLIRLNQEKHG